MPTAPTSSFVASPGSSCSAIAVTALGCTGPPMCRSSSPVASSKTPGTASETVDSEGRFRTSPNAPSSLWSTTSTHGPVEEVAEGGRGDQQLSAQCLGHGSRSGYAVRLDCRAVRATIYGVKPSPPTHSARLMAEHKGIDHKMVWILPGIHPVMIHARGFRGSTVPGDEARAASATSTRARSRGPSRTRAPSPRLFPEAPRDRLEVEEAERWGDEILQEAPRRIYRWVASNRPGVPGADGERDGLAGSPGRGAGRPPRWPS